MKGDGSTQPNKPTAFVEQTRGKSDRSVAIEASVLLNMHLSQLLSTFMVDDPDEVDALLREERALGNFASRIRAAYTLGLISKDERDDLRIVQYIYHMFTNQMEGIAFDDKKVREWCYLFKLRESIMLSEETLEPRGLFVFTVGLLVQRLSLRIRQAEKLQRKTPAEFDVN